MLVIFLQNVQVAFQQAMTLMQRDWASSSGAFSNQFCPEKRISLRVEGLGLWASTSSLALELGFESAGTGTK